MAQYEDFRQAEKSYPENVARKYIQRIDTILETRSFSELRNISALECHPLKRDRSGQWAIKLSKRYRLVFTLKGNQLEIVRIEEVSKHYGD